MGVISKEEVLKRIEYHQSNKVINRIKTTYAFELLKSEIEEIEEIVGCEECKHWNEETHGCNRNPSVNAWWETDFCNYGERRADDNKIKANI